MHNEEELQQIQEKPARVKQTVINSLIFAKSHYRYMCLSKSGTQKLIVKPSSFVCLLIGSFFYRKNENGQSTKNSEGDTLCLCLLQVTL